MCVSCSSGLEDGRRSAFAARLRWGKRGGLPRGRDSEVLTDCRGACVRARGWSTIIYLSCLSCSPSYPMAGILRKGPSALGRNWLDSREELMQQPASTIPGFKTLIDLGLDGGACGLVEEGETLAKVREPSFEEKLSAYFCCKIFTTQQWKCAIVATRSEDLSEYLVLWVKDTQRPCNTHGARSSCGTFSKRKTLNFSWLYQSICTCESGTSLQAWDSWLTSFLFSFYFLFTFFLSRLTNLWKIEILKFSFLSSGPALPALPAWNFQENPWVVGSSHDACRPLWRGLGV